MEKEYFTPDISELYQGYECEWFGQVNLAAVKKESWIPTKIHSSWNEPGKNIPFNRAYKEIQAGRLRTPKLTIEELEYHGYWPTDHSKKVQIAVKTFPGILDALQYDYEVFYIEKMSYMEIKKTTTGGYGGQTTVEVIFKGTCKSINEFKKLEEWFGMRIAYC